MPLAAKAHAFAAKAHAGVFRKWTSEPYVEHPARVAGMLAALGFADEVIAAAYLHDVVEDTEFTTADVAAEFGPTVAALVAEVTKPVLVPRPARAVRRAAFREHLTKSSYAGASIKLADLLDNLSNIEAVAPPAFATLFKSEARLLWPLLAHGEKGLYRRVGMVLFPHRI